MKEKPAMPTKLSRYLFYLYWLLFYLGFAARVIFEENHRIQKLLMYSLYSLGFVCAFASIAVAGLQKEKPSRMAFAGLAGGGLIVAAIILNLHFLLLLSGIIMLSIVALISLLPKIGSYVMRSYREMSEKR